MIAIKDTYKNDKHKKKLTFYPKSNFAGFSKPVKGYRIEGDKIIIPRFYAFQKLKWKPKKKNFIVYENLANFNGELRGYQQQVVQDTFRQFETFPGTILSLYTGGGKTIVSLKIISLLKVKTLIVVNKEVLMHQFIKQIEKFLPGAKIGKIQGSTFDTEEKDIVVGMLQTISNGKYPRSAYKQFDFAVFDEVHNIPGAHFSNSLFLIPSFYKMGLSATIFRQDTMERIAISHIGPVNKYESKMTIIPDIHVWKCPDIEINQEMTKIGKVNLSKMLTDLSMNEVVNKYILDLVGKYLLENRNILVFSDRVQQCKTLLSNLDFVSKGLFAGKMKPEERQDSLTKQVIFSTYSQFKEGVDLPRLDTVIFASPKVQVTQSIGRILRQVNENHPVVVDVLFSNKVLMCQFYKRNRYYRSEKYNVIRMDKKKKEQKQEFAFIKDQ